ncbi:22704_t:CDS:2 [Cetraspora pellucida]|uniref:22704_t:CDS:1 n=1 Tax=Cetraspora pellucida TaxID=1433469 RepID=A0A9N9CT79_9GLOM|nr:22704_t:CDS:2 [Cetraspora pellucida]
MPLQWRCAENHERIAKFSQIKDGHWCPYCAGNARSKNGNCISDKYINNNSKLPPKIHYPEFLKTLKYPTGLELDINCPQYDLAIEQDRDQLKKELCEENWIVLRKNPVQWDREEWFVEFGHQDVLGGRDNPN